MTGGFTDVNNKGILFIVAPKLTTGATGWAYVPSGNGVSGAQLRRTTDFITFSTITQNGFGVTTNTNFENKGLAEFNNGTQSAFFIGTIQGPGNAGQLYRSTDGVTFVNVGPGLPTMNLKNTAVPSLATLGTYFYMGTMNTLNGAEIFRSTSANATSSWVQVSTNGFGNAGNVKISYLKAWEGALYAGTEDNTNGGRIYRSINGTSWTLVADSTTFGLTTNKAIATIEDFNGKLYATTFNSVTGAQIWQTANGLTWTEVSLPGGRGFGSTANQEFHQAVAAFGSFFLGTWNQSVGAQVWRATDVVTGPWTQSNTNGWGNSNNVVAISQGSGLFNGQLYFGSSNPVQGAEIWNVGPPKAVTNLTALASPGTDGKIDLTWTSPDQLGAGSQFAIQYGSTNVVWSTGNAQIVLSTSGVASGATMTYQLSGLTMGTSYYSSVWTNNALGWSVINTASASAVAPNLAAPLAPTGLAVQAAGQTAVSLIWTANTEADLKDYRIWRSTNAGVTLVSTNTISTPTAANFLDLNLSTNTVYYYRVTARDSALNESPGSTEVSTLTAAGLRVWDGGGSGSSATAAANWQYDIPLSSGDSVLFDGAVSTKSATWDFTGAVKDLRLENGYTGTVTASGTATITTVQGNFNVVAGTFNATGSTLTVSGNFTQSGASGLNLASSIVKFDGTVVQTVSVLGGYRFNDFTVTSSSRVKAGTILNVDGALAVNSGEFTLRAPGDTFTGFHTFSGSATISGGKLDVGTSSATFNVGITQNSGMFVMPPSGGRVQLGGNFTVTGGTFQVMGVNNWITSADPGNLRYAFVLNAASINVTGMTVESVDLTGLQLNVSASTNIINFNNVLYRQGQTNGVALRDNLAQGQITFVGHDFDANFSTNVYAPSLSTTVYLIMSGATGAKAGSAYENDPGNGIYWGVPPVPGGFTAAASGPTSIAWSWTDGADEQGYRVKRATDNSVAFSTGPNYATWAQTGLPANTSQQMYVEAYNPVGTSSSAAITKFTNAVAPTGTSISARSSDTVTVAWVTGDPAGTVFEAQRATEQFFSSTVLATMTAVSYQFAGLLPNTSYYFRARAQNGDGIFSVFDSSVSTTTATDATAPLAPGGPAVLRLDGRINLNWTANSETDLKDYQIYRSTNGNVTIGSSWTVVATTILKPGTTHQDTALTNGTTFYYKISARDTSLNESPLSVEISTVPVGDTTPPAVPVGLVGYSGNTKLRLNWTANTEPDLKDYRVWRSTNAGVTLVSSQTVSTVTANTFLDTGLSNGTTYYYKITARDFTGNESAGGGEVGPPVPAVGERVWDGGGAGNSVTEAANWTNDLGPEAGDSVRYNATSTKTVTVDTASPGSGFVNLTIEAGYTGTITMSSAQVFTGNILQTGGTVNLGNLTHNFRGNITINGGTFNQSTGTVQLDGAAQTIAMKPGTQFWALTSTGTAIKTLASDITVGNDLNLWAASGYALDLGTNAVLVAGNVTNNGGSGLTGAAGSRVSLNGGGAGTQTVFAINSQYTDLEVNKSAGTASFGATGPTVRNVSIANGTADAGGTAVFTVGGNWTQTGGTFNPSSLAMTVLLSSPAAGRTVSQVAGSQFGVLKSSGTGNVVATTGITVKNTLDVLNGTFEFGGGTSTVSGQARVYGGATLIVSSAVVNFGNTGADSVLIDSGPTAGTFRMTTASPSPLVGLGGILTSSGTFESQSVNAVIRSTSVGSFIGINLSSGTVNISGLTARDLNSGTGVTVGSSVTVTAFNNVRYRNLQASASALRWNKDVNRALTSQDFDDTVATNIYTTAVSSPNFLNLSGATGPKAGETYEYDPNNRVFWGLPPIPAGLTATALSTTSIRWLWNPGPDEEDYRVVRTSDNFVLTTLLINTTFWDQVGLTPDATQQVFIRAHNPLGNADSGSFTRATLSSTPTASAVTSVSSQTVAVSWNANGNPGGTNYEAQLSTDAVFSTGAVTLSLTLTGAATTFTGLATKTSYYFQVRSRNQDTIFSSFTAIISTRTSPETQPPVTAITVPAAGGYVISLSTIQGTASDNLSGVATTYVQIRRNSDAFFWTGSVWAAGATDLQAVLSGPLTARAWTYDASGVTLTNGSSYNLYARSYDTEGNQESPAPVITVTADTVIPTSSVTTPSANGRYNALTPSGTSSDAAPGVVSRVEVRIKRISDGFYWNGTGFAAPVAWNVAASTNPWTYPAPPWVDGFQYEVTARAVDNANNTEIPTVGPTFTFDTVAPAAPTGLVVVDSATDQGTGLNLSWAGNVESDLKEYRVLRSTNGNVTLASTWTVSVAIIAQPGTTHQDVGLTPVTTYYYKVTARDTAGNESPTSAEVNLRPVDNLPPAPPAFPAGSVTDAPADQGFALRITWTLGPETDIREYQLYRSTNSGVTQVSSHSVASVLSPGSTHQDGGLTNGVTYYYVVSARDTSGNDSGVFPQNSAIPYDNLAPSSPAAFGVSPTVGGADAGGRLTLTWGANTEPDLKDYRVFRSTNGGIAIGSSWTVVMAVILPSGTTHQDAGLTDGATFYYRVTARDASLNESPLTAELSALPKDIVAPSPPTGFIVAQAVGSLNLNWSAVSDNAFKDYRVYRSTNIGVTIVSSHVVTAIAGGTTHQDSGLTNETTFYYKVTARDASLNESAGAAEQSGKPSNTADTTPPSIPTIPGAAQIAANSNVLALSWGASTDTGGSLLRDYRIYRSTNIGVTLVSSHVVTTVTQPGTTRQDDGLTNNTTFYYRVTARDNALNESAASSEFSSWPRDMIAPNAITNLVATTQAQVLLTWTAPSDNVGVTSYDIRYSTTGPISNITDWTTATAVTAGIPAPLAPGTTQTAVITGLKPRITHWFAVVGRDASGMANQIPTPVAGGALSGSFVLAQEPSGAIGPGDGAVAWGDYDGDGDLDLAVNGYDGTSWRFRVYRNDAGTFNLVQEPAGATGPGGAVAWGDFDNDGDLDLAVNGYDGGNRFRVYRNDGGTFNLVQDPAGATGPSDGTVAWGDFDNDGDLDLAVNGDDGVGRRFRVYRNDGGTFNLVQEPAGATGPGYQGSVAWGDFDNDGDLDLAVNGADGLGTRFRVYRNDGGTFNLVQEPAGATGPGQGSVAWGDYDNDGDLDIAVNGWDGVAYRFRVYRNDGGTFNLAQEPAGLTGPGYGTVAWGDFDNDGDLDLAVSGYDGAGYRFRVYRNDAGTFNLAQEPAGAAGGGQFGAVAWGDFDNDGDLDLAVNWQDSGTIYRFRVYKSLEADFGNVNSTPAAPSAGFATSRNINTRVLTLKWAAGSDSAPGATPPLGLNYIVRVATAPGPGGYVAPSATTSLKVSYLPASPFIGNYPHGYVSSSPAQLGVNYTAAAIATTYYWQVSSVDAGLRQSSVWSVEQSTFVDLQPPAVPVGLTTFDTPADQGFAVTLAWTGNTEADLSYYGVYRATYAFNSGAEPAVTFLRILKPGTTHQQGGLTNGATYYFRINAWDNDGNGSFITAYSSAMVLDNLAPSSPTAVGVTTPLFVSRAVDLSWAANTEPDLKDYRVYRATGAGASPSPTRLVTTVLPPGTSVRDAGLGVQTSFYYQISARDVSLNESTGSAEVVGNPAPSSPTAFGVTVVAAGRSLNLSWVAPSDTDLLDYRIRRATYSVVPSSAAPIVATIAAGGTTHQDAGLTDGTTYYYTVLARDNVLNHSALSTEMSATPQDTVAPSSPTAFGVVDVVSGGRINLSWAANTASDLKDYGVYQATWAGASPTPTPTRILAPGTTHQAGGLLNGSTYFFRLTARDNTGNDSLFSTELFAVPTSSIDATPPTATISSPATGNYYASTFTYTGTSLDSGGGATGVERVEVSLRNNGSATYWNGSLFSPTTEYWSIATGTATWSYVGPTTLAVGTTYLFGTRAKDFAGNVSVPIYSTFTFTARAKWLVALPGQTYAPGTPTGRSGAPSNRTAGVLFSATAYLTNTEFYTVSDASDTVTATTTDSFDVEPAPGPTTNGVRGMSFTLVTATPTATMSVSGSGYTANTSDGVTVVAGSPVKLQIILPGEAASPGSASGKLGTPVSQTAGVAFNATVNLTDANWNLVSLGPIIQILSSDAYATLPAAASLVSGTKSYSVTLKTAGSPVGVTASDTGALYTAQTSTISPVNPGSPTQLQVIAPGETAVPGSPSGKSGAPTTQIQRSTFSVTVRAVDTFWNLVSTTPVVTVVTNDPTDSEPPPAALVGGSGSFTLAFQSTNTTPGWTATASAASLTAGVSAAIPTVDGIPPVAIGDLAATTPASPEGAVKLTWTAPGDDGTIGAATTYLVRFTTGTGNFVTAANWPTATAYFPGLVPSVYGTAQTLTLTGLTPGTTFYFAVRAQDAAGNLATLSNSPAAPAQNVVPAAPVGPTAFDTPADQGGAVSLGWSSNTEIDLKDYRVYRSTNSGVVAGSTWTVMVAAVAQPGTTRQDVGLANGTTYYYRISARDLSLPAPYESVVSAEVSAVPYDNLVPAVPAGLMVTNPPALGNALNLAWAANAESDLKDYGVYRSTDAGFPAPPVGAAFLITRVLAPGTTHRDAGLTNNTTYYYRLTARDVNLNESGAPVAVAGVPSTVDTSSPSSITNLSALTGSGEGAVSLTWTSPLDNVAVSSYTLRASRTPITTQADFNAAVFQQTLSSPLAPGLTEIRTATVTAGVAWYFAVEAVDTSGNAATLSNIAVAVSSNPLAPAAPTALVAADARLGGKVNLAWTANTEPDAALYAVWRGTYSGFPDSKGVFLSSVTHPTAVYADANLVNGSTYFYHVYAVDLGGLRSLSSAEAAGMPTGAAALTVSGLPSPYTAGARADVVVAARAGDGSLSASYTGTVRFTAPTDPAAVLPGLYTFTSGYAGADNGQHIFKAGVILNTEGTQSVSVEDVANPSVAGKQTVTVVALGSIKGTVTRGTSKQAITGVLVTAKSLDNGTEFSATSLTDGTYEIKSLNKGRYKVTASWSEGGVTASVWLEANAGESARDFTLETKNGLGAVAGSVGSLVSASAKAGTARVVGLSPALAAQALAEDPTLPKVEVRLPGGRVIATVPVNPSGRFEAPNLLTENYEVRAWTGGAWSEPKRVSVLEGQTLSVDFEALGFVPGLATVGPNPAVNGQAPALWFYADWPSWEAKVSILDAGGAPVLGSGSGGEDAAPTRGMVIEREAGRAMAPARAFTHRAVWSGTNQEGRPVASGVYLFRVEVTNPETGETRSAVRKALVIR